MRKVIIYMIILVVLSSFASATLLFEENFNRADCTTDCWGTPTYNGLYYTYTEITHADYEISNGVGWIDDTAIAGNTNARTNLTTTIKGDYIIDIELDWKRSSTGECFFVISNDTSDVTGLWGSGSSVSFRNGTAGYHTIRNNNLNTWENYRINLNSDTETARIYVDDILNLTTTFKEDTEFTNLRFIVGGATTCDNYFDNVTITDVGVNFSISSINAINSSYIKNFSAIINGTTYYSNVSTGVLNTPYNRSKDYVFNISVSSDGYLTEDYDNYNLSTILIASLTPQDSINVTFYHELNWSKFIEQDITLEVISEDFSNNYTITNGVFKLNYIPPASYRLRYSADNYTERVYYVTFISTNYSNLNLYLLKNTSATEVTAIVYDQSNNLLEDVELKLLKYDIITNSYKVVEICKTNFLGECLLDVELNNEFYKFALSYGGVTKKITNATYIYETTLSFQIITGDSVGNQFYVVNGVDGSLTFNNATNKFVFIFNDPSNTLYQGCLSIYQLTRLNKDLLNYTCTIGSAGTIAIGVPEVNGTTYQAIATIGFNPTNEFFDSLEHAFQESIDTGSFGMFLIAILTIVAVGIGIWNIPLAVLLAPLPMLLGSYIGIINVDLSIMFGLEIVAIIVAYVIVKKKQ